MVRPAISISPGVASRTGRRLREGYRVLHGADCGLLRQGPGPGAGRRAGKSLFVEPGSCGTWIIEGVWYVGSGID